MKLETDEEEAIRTVARGTDETEANNANENVERPRIKSKWNQAPDNSQTTEDKKTAAKKLSPGPKRRRNKIPLARK